ncbi:hypothetical protein C8F01DRAFT_1089156 [Mycena amicta]|nr:hypothetical protein C8F01DRAFT_1089156 [Mycena amicta]
MYLGSPSPAASSSSAASFCAFARNTIHSSIDTAADTARVLFSFEFLLVAAILVFIFLGIAFFMLLWSFVGEEDDYYEHAEEAVYHEYAGNGRWLAVPVILMPHASPHLASVGPLEHPHNPPRQQSNCDDDDACEGDVDVYIMTKRPAAQSLYLAGTCKALNGHALDQHTRRIFTIHSGQHKMNDVVHVPPFRALSFWADIPRYRDPPVDRGLEAAVAEHTSPGTSTSTPLSRGTTQSYHNPAKRLSTDTDSECDPAFSKPSYPSSQFTHTHSTFIPVHLKVEHVSAAK